MRLFAVTLIAATLSPVVVFAGDADMAAAGHAAPAQAEHLTISSPFTRATLPNAPVAGGFPG